MRKKSSLITKIATFALAGVMAVGMCGTENVAKAAEGDVEINATNFPDERFREYVKRYDVGFGGVGNNDGILSEMERAISTMDCGRSHIKSLKGIEYFPYLKELDCSANELTKLDLSNNKNLETLYCYGNQIESLDFSSNEALKEINCESNKLTSLNLNNNYELEILYCHKNQLDDIDVSNNAKLYHLDISDNKLNELNVDNNTSLRVLECNNNNLSKIDVTKHLGLSILEINSNQLKELDVSNNTKLVSLKCSDNQLTELDLTNNTKLDVLKCSDNQLTELDVSANTLIRSLECNNNQLTKLDISNNYDLYDLQCQGNQIKVINTSNNIIDSEHLLVDSSVIVIETNVSSITLNKTQVDIENGKNFKLTATVDPASADLTTVNWTSSNPTVATVDANGSVTAKSVGTATITATAADMSGVTASCAVTVKASSSTDDNTGTTGGNAGSTDDNAGSSDDNTGSSGEDAGSEEAKVYPAVNISYRTHIQTYGWEGDANDITTWKSNGEMSGTSGKSKRLEGINIVVASADSKEDLDLCVQYTTHCQSYGWLPWSADGDMNGTEGEAKRLEAIMIKLTGADADAYDVYYRVHAQTYGWLGWAKNGAPAGTAGYAKRLEGIQIVVVKKNESFNQKMGDITSARTESFVAKEGDSPIVNYPSTSNTNPVVPGADTPNVAYRTHVQSYGWQAWKYNGQMSGTSGESKRLEGINIKLTNKPYAGGIVYTTHVQSYGWQGDEYDSSKWKSNGQMSGTSGEAKRLEAIKIKLTGEMANHYDIYYRVHAQSYGWLAWASNGAPAGTAGYGKRLEGIQIVLVKKGDAAPGKSYKGIDSVNDKAYISKTASSSKDMTFECNDKSSFQLKTHLTYEKTGHYVKELKGWTYSVSKFDGCNYDEFVKDGIHIRYSAMTEDQVNDEIDQISEDGNLASLDYLRNEDSSIAIVTKCTYDGSDRNIKLGFRYYIKLSDGKYLSIFVYDEQGGSALGNAKRDTFLPLTENKFYIQAN